jgi:hypothetical protein
MMIIKWIVNVLGIAVACLGVYIVADGIGSIFEQENQPFFWWQFVRIFRSCIGGTLVAIGTALALM